MDNSVLSVPLAFFIYEYQLRFYVIYSGHRQEKISCTFLMASVVFIDNTELNDLRLFV